MSARTTLGVSFMLVLAGCPGTFNQPLHLPMKFGPKEQVAGRVVLHNIADAPIYVHARTPCGGGVDPKPSKVEPQGGLAMPFIRERTATSSSGSTGYANSFVPTEFVGPLLGGQEIDKGFVIVACRDDSKQMVELDLAFTPGDDDVLFVSGWKAHGRKPLASPTVVIEVNLTGICDVVTTKVPVRLVYDCSELDETGRLSLPECR